MDREKMMKEIEQYRMKNGYFDTVRMRVELAGMSEADARYDAFWGSTDVGEATADRYPMIALAETLNDKRDEGIEEEEQAEQAEQVEAALERYHNDAASNEDLRLLVKAGVARNVYGDPDSNRPTGIELLSRPQRSGADADVEY